MSRDQHKVDVCLANAETGDVKTVVEERLNTYIETHPLRLIGNGEELLFWSERDGWGHYYLYDANGTLKNQVTSGEYVTEDIDSIDEKTRTITFVAEGHEAGENPYFTHLYSVKLDGSGLKLLDAGNASHTAEMADDGKYFVDNSSTVSSAPRSVLVGSRWSDDYGSRNHRRLGPDGRRIPHARKFSGESRRRPDRSVRRSCTSRSISTPTRSYPIIAFVYPGPQTESVTQTFSPKNANVALAQLGFIVIEVGNRGGNPHRSKWYHNYRLRQPARLRAGG